MKTNSILAESDESKVLNCEFSDLTIEAASEENKSKNRKFTMNAYNGGSMSVSYWYNPVVIELSGLNLTSQIKPIYLQHIADIDYLIGQTSKVEIKGNSLVASGEILGDSDKVKQVLALADKGFKWQASVGVRAEEVEKLAEKQTAVVNGQKFTGPINIIRKSSLGEISFVMLGADESTSANIAAKNKPNLKDNTMKEKLIQSILANAKNTLSADELNGKDVKELEAIIASFDVKEVKAEVKKETTKEADPVEAIRAAAASEMQRIADIQEVCKDNPAIAAKAISEKWDKNKAELEVLRASRPSAGIGIKTEQQNVNSNVLEAAALMSGGIKADEVSKSYDAKTIDAASKIFKGRLSLNELIIEAARMNGFVPRSFRNEMRPTLEAAFSTLDLSGILGNVANKFLLQGFNGIEQTWRSIAGIRPVKDFKQTTAYRLSGGFEYDEVGPDGELKHGTVGEDSYTNQAKTYGKMFSITRQDLINDDLGALTVVPQRIGRGGALKLNTVFWTAFMDNSTFFTSARGNYTDGATTALSINALTAAELLFLNQTDSDSNPLAITPQILLVPNALNAVAAQLMNSTEIRDTTSSTKYATSNPHAGKFKVERSSYLSNSSITGYSSTAWYLLANPADLAVIEVVFLNGVETPTVESADADFNTLGIQMRGYFDFGVSKQEYRAGVKVKGAA